MQSRQVDDRPSFRNFPQPYRARGDVPEFPDQYARTREGELTKRAHERAFQGSRINVRSSDARPIRSTRARVVVPRRMATGYAGNHAAGSRRMDGVASRPGTGAPKGSTQAN